MYFYYVFQYVAPAYLPVAYEGLPSPPGHRDAVINAYVYVHQTLHQANARVAKRGSRTMSITPRHYLDFINHFVSHLSSCFCQDFKMYLSQAQCITVRYINDQ